MAVSAEYVAYVIDQLAPFASVVSRRMFGGAGLYADDLFFALIAEDTLYFKVDDSNRDDYLARGCEAFRPFPEEPRKVSMNYYRVPADVLEDPDELLIWARKSLRVAAGAAAARDRKRPSTRTGASARRARPAHKSRR